MSDWARAITELPDAISVLSEVAGEWYRLEKKYPGQQHPDGTGPTVMLDPFGPVDMHDLRVLMAKLSERDNADGNMTWLQVLLNEVFEAAECSDRVKLATQLLQVAAVAGKWLSVIVTDLSMQPVFLVRDSSPQPAVFAFDAAMPEGLVLQQLPDGQVVIADTPEGIQP